MKLIKKKKEIITHLFQKISNNFLIKSIFCDYKFNIKIDKNFIPIII